MSNNSQAQPKSAKEQQKAYMTSVLKSEKRNGTHDRHSQGQHAYAEMPFGPDDVQDQLHDEMRGSGAQDKAYQTGPAPE